MTLYTVTGPNGEPCWPIPTGKHPGEWTPIIEDISAIRGYQLYERRNIIERLYSDYDTLAVWLAEGRGQSVEVAGCVTTFAQARLLECVGTLDARDLRLFACDCAEHALLYWLSLHPDDTLSVEAIDAARRYARGDETISDFRAMGEAVWDARFTAYPAAVCVMYESPAKAASATASKAADAVYGIHGGVAACDSASYATECAWQTDRLFAYLRGENAEGVGA